MKALGLTLLLVGALLLLAPIVLVIWTFQMYSVGVSIEGYVGLLCWLIVALSMTGFGLFLLRKSR